VAVLFLETASSTKTATLIMAAVLSLADGKPEGFELNPALVGGEHGRRRGPFVLDCFVDALAHVASAAAALGALATGPEHIDRTTGAGPHGGVDFTFANGPADADKHALAFLYAVATYSQVTGEDKRHSQLGQVP